MCKKNIGLLIIRLALGGLLLMGGLGKIMGATPEMMTMIGWAAHSMGLTFLSTTVWFWMAAVGETLAWTIFLLGLFLPLGSVLTIIIAIVAFVGAHKMDMQSGMPVLFMGVIALGMWFAGPGKYSLKALCCKWTNNCDTNYSPKTPTTTEVISA